MSRKLRALGFLGAFAAALFECPLTLALEPYHSTDADTAEPLTLEGRVGFSYIRDEGDDTYTTPLLTASLGITQKLELTGELAYVPAQRRLSDAEAGLKWVPYFHELSLGIEALALLPVSSAGGAGVGTSLLATERVRPVQLHVNLGGFYDSRPEPIEKGVMAGLIAELECGRFRPGVELFAVEVQSEPVAIQAGGGAIVAFGPIDLRSGAHVGLTDEAPDFEVSVWVSGELSLADDSPRVEPLR